MTRKEEKKRTAYANCVSYRELSNTLRSLYYIQSGCPLHTIQLKCPMDTSYCCSCSCEHTQAGALRRRQQDAKVGRIPREEITRQTLLIIGKLRISVSWFVEMIYRINIPFRKWQLELPTEQHWLYSVCNCHHFSFATSQAAQHGCHTVAAGHEKDEACTSHARITSNTAAGSCEDYTFYSRQSIYWSLLMMNNGITYTELCLLSNGPW